MPAVSPPPDVLAAKAADADARTLAAFCFDARSDDEALTPRIERLLAQAARRGTTHTRWLACAFLAMREAALQRLDGAVRDRVQHRLQALGSSGCRRALWLAQAAWAHVVVHHSADTASLQQARELLLAQGPAHADQRPAQERCWTDAGLCLLHSALHEHAAAVAAGRQALALAGLTQRELLHAQAAHTLACALLHAGAPGEAVPLLQQALLAHRRCGRPLLGAYFHLLLALLLDGQTAAAGQLLDNQPALFESPLLAELPGLCALAALVRARQGQAAAARALLDELPAEADLLQGSPEPDLLWTSAEAELLLGQAELARRRAMQGLEQLRRWPAGPPALHLAQLQRVLAQACLAQGDLPAALQVMQQMLEPGVQRPLAQAVGALLPDGGGQGLCPQALRLAVERTRAEADSARQAQAAQRRFLAYIAHEMRNPAAGIAGLTGMLLAGDLQPAQREQLQLVQQAAQMMMGLCNDLVDLARMAAGSLQLRPQPVAVGRLLLDAARGLQPLAAEKQLALHWTLPDDLPPSLLCDPLRLQQLLLNLLSNAIKYTQRGAVRLQVGWQPDVVPGAPGQPPGGGMLQVLVRDTGPGLDAQAQARLFVDYTQLSAPAPDERSGPGHGLGLALCRSLVQQMGGEIGVESSPGQGSSFWFRLPLQPPTEGGLA